jgi:hypothetical protein
MEAKLVSTNGVILDYDPVSDRFIEQSAADNPFAQGNIVSICAVGTEFLAVTQSGVVCKTVDSCSKWVRVLKGHGGPIHCYVVYVSPVTGTWFVGGVSRIRGQEGPVIFRSTNQGVTWTWVSLPVDGNQRNTPLKITQTTHSEFLFPLICAGGNEYYNTTTIDASKCFWYSFNDGVSWINIYSIYTTGAANERWNEVLVLNPEAPFAEQEALVFNPKYSIAYKGNFHTGSTLWREVTITSVDQFSGSSVNKTTSDYVRFLGEFVCGAEIDTSGYPYNYELLRTTDFSVGSYTRKFILFSDPLLNELNTIILLFVSNGKLRIVTRRWDVYELTDFDTFREYIGNLGFTAGEYDYSLPWFSRFAAASGDRMMIANTLRYDTINRSSGKPGVRATTWYSADAGASLTRVSSSQEIYSVVRFGELFAWLSPGVDKSWYYTSEFKTTTIYFGSTIDHSTAQTLSIPSTLVLGADASIGTLPISPFGRLYVQNGRLYAAPLTREAEKVTYIVSTSSLTAPDWSWTPLPSFQLIAHYATLANGVRVFASTNRSASSAAYTRNHHYFVWQSPETSLETYFVRLPYETLALSEYPNFSTPYAFASAFQADGKFFVYEAANKSGSSTYHHILWETSNGVTYTGTAHDEMGRWDIYSAAGNHLSATMFPGSDALYCTMVDTSPYPTYVRKVYKKPFIEETFSLFYSDAIAHQPIVCMDEDGGHLFFGERSGGLVVVNKADASLLQQVNSTKFNFPISHCFAVKESFVVMFLAGAFSTQADANNCMNMYKWNGSSYALVSTIALADPYASTTCHFAFERSGVVYFVTQSSTHFRLYSLNVASEALTLSVSYAALSSQSVIQYSYNPLTDILHTGSGFAIDMTDLSQIAQSPAIICSTMNWNSGNLNATINKSVEHFGDFYYTRGFGSNNYVSLMKVSGGVFSNLFYYGDRQNTENLVSDENNHIYASHNPGEGIGSLRDSVIKTSDFKALESYGMPMTESSLGSTPYHMGVVPIAGGLIVRELWETATYEERTIYNRGVSFTIDGFESLQKKVFLNTPMANVDLRNKPTSYLQSAFLGNGALWLLLTHGLYKTRDLIHWEIYLLESPLVTAKDKNEYSAAYITTDSEFRAGEFSPPVPLLAYWAGSHLLRSLVWEKQPQFYLGFLTQRNPPIEVDAVGYARQVVSVSDAFWSPDFINQARINFASFAESFVGWALYTHPVGGFVVHAQALESTMTFVAELPGPSVLRGGFTFTFD